MSSMEREMFSNYLDLLTADRVNGRYTYTVAKL